MFESKLNRGRANGYAPLDSEGKVPLDRTYVGANGTSGSSGSSGTSGSSGAQGSSGESGTSGSSGTSGTSGVGTNGTSGTSGVGTNGTSGSSGVGTNGTSGSSGESGIYIGNSNTNINLGSLVVGNTTSLVTDIGLSYTIAQHLIVVNSNNNHFHGDVIEYDSVTGDLAIKVTTINGSGQFSYWTTNLDGAAGGNGTSGSSGSAGTSGTSGSSGTSGTSPIGSVITTGSTYQSTSTIAVTSTTPVDILSFTIPVAGTFEIVYFMRAQGSSETFAGEFLLTDNSNNILPNSEILSYYNTTVASQAATGTGKYIVTTTGSTTYKLRAFASAGSFSSMSDNNGRTGVIWNSLSGQGTSGTSGTSGSSGSSGNSGSSGTSGTGSSGTSGTSFSSPYAGNLNGTAGQSWMSSFGATTSINWNNGNVQTRTLAASETFTFANPNNGATYILVIKQAAAGGYTITWPTITWLGGAPPTMTATANKTDIYTFVYVNSTYYGSYAQNF